MDGVFIESPVSDQKSIDYYANTGKFDEKMLSLIKGAKKEGKDIKKTLQAILNYGKNFNKPIIAIDSSKKQNRIYQNKSKHGYYFHKGKSREEDMYTNILDRYKDGEHWILICGAKHLELGNHHRSGAETLGTRLKKHYGDDFIRIALITNNDSTEKIQSAKGYLAGFDGYVIAP